MASLAEIDDIVRARRWPEAERAIRGRMWTAPGNAALIATLAIVCASTDRSGHGLALAAQAVALRPDRSRPWFALAYVRHQRCDVDGAVTAYERSLELWPGPTAATNLARLLLSRNDADRAEAVVRRQLQHTPDDIHLLAILATIAGRKGHRRERAALLWRRFRVAPSLMAFEDLIDGLGLIRVGWAIAILAYGVSFAASAFLRTSVVGRRWFWPPVTGMLTVGALALLAGQLHRRRRRLPTDGGRIVNCCWVLATFGLAFVGFWAR